jgi:hypothetical protein
MTYEVTQTLAKKRVVRVEATSKQEAINRAQQGYGEVVSPIRERYGLLCSDAVRLENLRHM